MLKWILYGVLALGVGGSWIMYAGKASEARSQKEAITAQKELGDDDPEGLLPEMEAKLQSLEGDKTTNGIMLTFLTAGLLGTILVAHVIPFMADRVTQSVFDSGEVAEKSPMDDARSLVAQGDYAAAIEAYRLAAAADPLNRLPWVEIVKIQKETLEDPHAAVATIRLALESQEWEVNDAAYFLFRLAELYDEVLGDREAAVGIMHQVIADFPQTRHSANASHKLHEWETGVTTSKPVVKELSAAEKLAAEEAEFLAKMNQNS
jgi:tetratricopeptide (TPR) repeat protein